MNIIAIVQARMGSSRLPNKTLSLLAGKPLIWHVFNRISYSKKITKAILATTVNPKDEVLIDWANRNEIDAFRGSEDNVLERFYLAAKPYNPDLIVRVTADDPFKDPFVIDKVITYCVQEGLDFACNNNPPTFPEGLDTEVFKFKALELAYNKSASDFEKEHVTQFFYRNPDLISQGNVKSESDKSWLRWTIDKEIDLQMARIIYDNLYKEGDIFNYQDILNFLDNNEDVAKMNLLVERSEMYKNIE
nr:glycosyltransferase family protein [uncultured Mucilaginibacter sp.]